MNSAPRHSRIDPTRLLHDGVEAIRSGDWVHGRDLLLDAVELEPALEEAWWWLSETGRSTEEQIEALEQVLRLNPERREAAGRLAAARQQLEAPAPIPDEDDVAFSPYQCIYCGVLTAPDDRRCPHCRRDLMTTARVKRSRGLNVALLIFAGWNAQMAVWLALIPFLARSEHTGMLLRLGRLQLVQFVFTDFLSWSPRAANVLVAFGLMHVGLLLVVVLGLVTDAEWIYGATLIIAPLDLAMLAVGFWLRYVSLVFFGLHVVMGLAQMLLVLVSNAQLASNSVREQLRIDKKYAPSELYKLGHEYGRHGKWALATLAWQQAAVKKAESRYFYQLGVGYARLSRYGRANRALQKARRLAPDNTQIAEALAIVEQRLAQ